MCQTDTLLYCPAFSKINLYLKITGRRSDGYHTLESFFLPLEDPADDVAIDLEAAPGTITVGCSDILLPGGMGNIAGRAADLWAKKAAVMPHWDININKNIPVAAGMGGGSSDAAAVLKLLNDHFGTPLDTQSLRAAALELGADVPYFLDPEPAVMRGVGEIAEALDFVLPELFILLAAPQFPVSAAEGYRLMMPEKISPMDEVLRDNISSALRTGDHEKLAKYIFNDLEAGVFEKYPLLTLLQKSVLDTGALCCRMTGSGPTLFALYADQKSLLEAAEELTAVYPEYLITPAAVRRS